MRYVLFIMFFLLFSAGFGACSKTSKIKTDTDSTIISGDSDTVKKGDTDTTPDKSTDKSTDKGTDISSDTTSDKSTDDNTDSNTDTAEDTGSDSVDIDTEVYVNPCPDGQHAACYGGAPWCFNGDEPIKILDTCTAEEYCYEPNDFYADCRCERDVKRQCMNGDVWAYNSCGELDKRILACTGDSVCRDLSDTDADCCSADVYQECGTDDNIHWVDKCELTDDIMAGIAVDCGDNAKCENNNSTPSCECTGNWSGENCDNCPVNWNASTGCDSCAGEWSGADCTVCKDGAVGDHCQCPGANYFPQPGTNLCWACPYGQTFENGVCNGTPFKTTQVVSFERCPDGFRLPTKDELASLFENCTFEHPSYSSYTCTCAGTSVCDMLYGGDYSLLSTERIWTSTDCSTDTDETAGSIYAGAIAYNNTTTGIDIYCYYSGKTYFTMCVK